MHRVRAILRLGHCRFVAGEVHDRAEGIGSSKFSAQSHESGRRNGLCSSSIGRWNSTQRALLYAQRADTEIVFDELKNLWAFGAIAASGLWWANRRLVDLQPVESLYAADGIEFGASFRSDQIAAGLFVPGGASGSQRAAAHGETGDQGGMVAGVNRRTDGMICCRCTGKNGGMKRVLIHGKFSMAPLSHVAPANSIRASVV